MSKIDKYKIAAELLKGSDPAMTRKEALELAKEVVRIYLEYPCSIEWAIAKAKEMAKC